MSTTSSSIITTKLLHQTTKLHQKKALELIAGVTTLYNKTASFSIL